MWVFDATPLIYLAKADRLSLLEYLDGRRLIPEPVYDEVVTGGVDAGYTDARRLERAVDEGAFEVVPVPETPLSDRLGENPNLSPADVAVLGCAEAHAGTAVMDEAYGRDVAAVEGIETRGTAYLVLSLVERGATDASTARATIDAMLDAGWYCAPDLYATLVQKLEDLAD